MKHVIVAAALATIAAAPAASGEAERAAGLAAPLLSLAHSKPPTFNLESYNGDYVSLSDKGTYCGVNFLFSGNLLIATWIDTSDGECTDSGKKYLFDCDRKIGICHRREHEEIQIILLQSGNYVLENPSREKYYYYRRFGQ